MSIAGIRINQPFNNDALSVGGSRAEALLGDVHLVNWFQADPRSVDLDGAEIISFTDKKGTGAKFTRASSANSATLANGLFGIYPGARFNASESDKSVFSGAASNLSLPFTWAGVATLNNNAAAANLMGTFTSTTVRSILNVSGGTAAMRLQFGTVSTGALAIPIGQPFAFAAGFDGTNIFLMVNGAVSVVAAAGAPSISALSLGALPGGGQFWDGNVSDIFICDIALNSPAPAATTLLSKIRGFTQRAYGLSA
jgi:hypothetical protein